MTNLNLDPQRNAAGVLETQPMTREASLLWLAGLERPCTDCTAKDGVPCNCLACNGTGKVPVLDLRVRCPWKNKHELYDCGKADITYNRERCPLFDGPRCPGWLPRQGRDALHLAMNKDGWDIHTSHYAITGHREVSYFKRGLHYEEIQAWDADDWVAASQALRRAGYGG